MAASQCRRVNWKPNVDPIVYCVCVEQEQALKRDRDRDDQRSRKIYEAKEKPTENAQKKAFEPLRVVPSGSILSAF